MKTTLRDSILVGAALITILASGFGLGRLSPRESAPAPTVPVDNLTTLVLDSRQQALIQYYESLLNFHGEIATKLNLRQKKILEANRKLLQQEFSNRFNPQS